MAPRSFFLFLSLLAVAASVQEASAGKTLSFEFHHRFSDRVRRWAESENPHGGPWHWPEKGSVDYYAALFDHDRLLRGRMLAGSRPKLTFLSGNETFQIPNLGFLHYAEVVVGTPGKRFFVALDTGSDLFWLPCNCISCAPVSSPDYGLGPDVILNVYDPRLSSTSKRVPCSSSYCELSSQCSTAENQCPYHVKYLSENTSTTGVLVQDVLRLRTDESEVTTVDVEIIVGCGQTQTGHFLDRAAPNGLFGLGLDPVSVPSILSKSNITSNSFSMCFSPDGLGRIRFGDQGSSDQAESPLIIDPRHPTYEVKITGLKIGQYSFVGTTRAIMDSGTSFTYLTEPTYSVIAKRFDSSIKDQRYPADPRIPFEYCYVLSNNLMVPDLGLTLEGGREFSVYLPVAGISLGSGGGRIFCLGIINSKFGIDIIGQNFMTGHRIVFDGERGVLGWKKFDCYEENSSDSWLPAPTTAPASSPIGPVAPPNTPRGTNETVTPSSPSLSLSVSCLWCALSLLSLLFLRVIL